MRPPIRRSPRARAAGAGVASPAQRPLQITRDLSAFWKGAYREVQKR
ncbi:ATP-dependent helicase C-terminal domain-containing protein [Escherichia coli]